MRSLEMTFASAFILLCGSVAAPEAVAGRPGSPCLMLETAKAGGDAKGAAAVVIQPLVLETRTIALTQTVTLHDVPKGAQEVQLWAPLPGDAAWQRVLDRCVISTPEGGTWRIVRQDEGRGEFLHVRLRDPKPGDHSVVVQCIVERQGVSFPLVEARPARPLQPSLFEEHLNVTAPLMNVDQRIQQLADRVCGSETDPARQAMMLLRAVAEEADHYSKDPSKPTCGRGSAQDCLDQGGGCCTDLHSLFIALARARGIPARLQFGYRALDAREGVEYDPGYRCWVEFFIAGAGWIPTDIVAADSDKDDNPHRWASLAASKVWLWEGRSFELTPRGTGGGGGGGPVHTMLCGWAEIDGTPVDVLPAEDGTPSKLRRTMRFEVISRQKHDEHAPLPQ